MTEEKKSDLKLPDLQELLEAGAHSGHQKAKWHPKIASFIFGVKNGVHIFDLEKTLQKFEEAIIFLRGVAGRGGMILFVGTKPAAKNLIKEAAMQLNMPYVTERWLGGTLTNFKTVTKRLGFYRDLDERQKTGQWGTNIKKEQVKMQKKLAKLEKQLGGIKNLMRLPEAVFVSDVKADNIAVREATKAGIPVAAICDSNINPELVNYPIPGNDDSSSSLKIFVDAIVGNLKNVKPVVKPAEDNKSEKII